MRPAAGWVPWSPCDASCLPAPGSLPAASALRRAWRWAAAGAVVLLALVVSLVVPFVPGRDRVVRTFCRWLLAALGVRLRVEGTVGLRVEGTVGLRVEGEVGRRVAGGARAGSVGVLVVANHISWLDVIALLAVEPVGMLAKRETRDWPLVGAIADRIGTVYADRERLRTLPDTVSDVASMLRSGRSMVVFPEATTWCGTSSGTFRPAMFQAAVDAGAPVLPVRVQYRLAGGDPTTVTAFIGDDTLVESLRRIIRADGLVVEVRPGPALAPEGGRRHLARTAEAASCPPTALSHPALTR